MANISDMVQESEWREALRPGDEVLAYISGRWGRSDGEFIGKIERLTPSLIILTDGTRFKKDSGRVYASEKWGQIKPLTSEKRTELAAKDEARRLRSWFSGLSNAGKYPPTAVLAAMKEVYDRMVTP